MHYDQIMMCATHKQLCFMMHLLCNPPTPRRVGIKNRPTNTDSPDDQYIPGNPTAGKTKGSLLQGPLTSSMTRPRMIPNDYPTPNHFRSLLLLSLKRFYAWCSSETFFWSEVEGCWEDSHCLNIIFSHRISAD